MPCSDHRDTADISELELERERGFQIELEEYSLSSSSLRSGNTARKITCASSTLISTAFDFGSETPQAVSNSTAAHNTPPTEGARASANDHP